ncbi:unnamed protein product [Ilex paraguariensis]|uniref:BACK domain-containing protein n=1 Tax=Ilex paraguariensis TaxID=185542 RepID=A0ABC8SNW5_9AQUA
MEVSVGASINVCNLGDKRSLLFVGDPNCALELIGPNSHPTRVFLQHDMRGSPMVLLSVHLFLFRRRRRSVSPITKSGRDGIDPDRDAGGITGDEVIVVSAEELVVPSLVFAAKPIDSRSELLGDCVGLHKAQVGGRYLDEVMSLPLAGIEAILASDDLQVASEDAVYDFVLKWARVQYPKLEERREILGSRLGRFIRFPYMTCRKLKKVLTCNDFDHDLASKVVLEALFFKAEAPHRQRTLAAEEPATTNRRFVERAYKYRPVKVVEFELPRQQCVVYLDLKREECANLFPSGRVYSQAFHLGGQGFFLSAHCNMDQQSSFHCFGLFLGMQEKGSVTFAVDYEFAARSKPTEEYISKYKGNYTFTGGKAVGYRNLFAIPWTSFMAEDSLYFINGILHLRAELTIRQ